MDPAEVTRAASAAELAAAIESADDLHMLHGMHMEGGASMRRVAYRGHEIRIATTYDIRVDDVPVTGHLIVSNEGTVHYHAIPNQEFDSAVDLVKRIIDLAPEEFETPPPAQHDDAAPHHDAAHHDPGHHDPLHPGGM